jgi:Ras-related protein Rab-28
MSANVTTLKVMLCGNGSAGKTSLCQRFRTDGFERVYRQTVGVDFYEKTVQIRGRSALLQVWDIGGQSIGSRMLSQYVRGAAIAFVCYDVTDTQSFADAEDWLRVLRADAGSAPRDIYLMGNKADLINLRRVTPAAAGAFAEKEGLSGSFSVSARTGDGVLTAFHSAAARALGLALTDEEVELTVRVLAVTVDAKGGADDARVAGADDIERQDAAMRAERDRREAAGGCCCVA